MGRFIQPAFLRCMLGLTVLVSGCATSASGVKNSRINSVTAAQKLTANVPPGTVMAVLRYPAHIEEAAEFKFHNRYASKTIGNRSYSDDAGLEEIAAIADNMLLKSNYFALSIYKELSERMPEHSVLLSPHVIKLDERGKLTSEPMTQAETLPNIVSIDFTAYSFPDVKRMLDGDEAVSFGDIITPLVTVRTDHRASAPTQGVLLTSRPTLRGAVANGRQTIAQNLLEFETGKLEPNILELDFITTLNNTVPTRVVSQQLSKTTSDNTLSTLPFEQIRLDGTKIVNLNNPDAVQEDPVEGQFSASLANQVVGMINKLDIKKASMMNNAIAISQFDVSLAPLTLIGSTDPEYLTRERYAARLLEAEQNYLSVQSLRLFDGVYNGELGVQVRETLKAEYEVLQERRDLTRKQNTSAIPAILTTVAAGAAAAATRSRRSTRAEDRARNALFRSLILAGANPSSFARRKRLLGNNYFTSFLPAIQDQISVQVNLIDSSETITAIRYEDLREQLHTRYQDNQRALDTVATRCEYLHDGNNRTKGTWMGICDDGLANGAGIGVLRNIDGSAIEYYGYAQNGKPQGAGYLILHGRQGSHSLEGTFDEGLANGAIRVSIAGKDDVIRTYRKGLDVGKSAKGQAVISPFDGPL